MDIASDINELNIPITHKLSLYQDSHIGTDNSTIIRAQDLNTMSDVCVKVINISGKDKREKERSLDKAKSEARMLGWLSTKTRHVPALRYTYFGETSSNLYIVMDWLQGKTLDCFMGEGGQRANNRQFIIWMIELCNILEYLEQRHGAHKDIKPANLIIDKDRKLNLIDFNVTASLANKVEGTPGYRAPEMEPGMAVGNRTKVDMFSIGVIMYEFFAGKKPVKGKEYATSMLSEGDEWSRFTEPKQINPEVPQKINDIIVRCMNRHPDNRYRSIKELKHQLMSANSGKAKRNNHAR